MNGKILLSKEEANKLKQKLKDHNKLNKSPNLFETLKINQLNVNSYFKKISNKVSLETCFDVFKLSQFFTIRPRSKKFFEIENCPIHDILKNLAIILQSIQNEEEEKLFDDFLESGDLIQLLSQQIKDCFQSRCFAYLRIRRIIKIIEKRIELGSFIPSDLLYSFISKSINERFVLLRYLNFNYLRSIQSISIPDFKLYVIHLIKQYDECLSSILALDQNGSKQLDCFKKLYQNGNQIAAYYLNSQKLNDKSNPKSEKINSTKKKDDSIRNGIKNREDFSRTMINIPNQNRLNLIQFNESDDENDNPKDEHNDNNRVQKKKQSLPNSKSNKKKVTKFDDLNNNNYSKTTKQMPNSKSQFNKKGQIQNDDEYYYYEEDYDDNDDSNKKKIPPPPPTIAKNTNITQKTKKTSMKTQSDRTIKTGHYYRPLTAEDKERAIIWKETDKILKSGFYKDDTTKKKYDINEDIEFCINNTKNIKPDYKFKIYLEQETISKKEEQKILSRVRVVNKSTFEAARAYNKNDKCDVCVLNFASAVQPGGGVINGRGAQEETLSRMSSLYYSLTKSDEMYKYHKEKNDPFYSDYMIFSPDVVVFRDDDYNLIKYYHVSVISSAAVNCQEVKQVYGDSKKVDKKIYNVMKNRCRKILQLCLENDIRIIILGAFGCGVFKNRPEDVSNIFRELIVDEGYGLLFDRIIFAIKSPPKSPNYTLKQFKKAFNIDN